jgi:hypothetical protein
MNYPAASGRGIPQRTVFLSPQAAGNKTPRDSIKKKIDQLVLLMTAIVGAFAAIVAITIGFAIWDRRTAVRPLQAQIRLLENEKVEKMRKVMLAYAEENKDWAAVLRNFGLL